MNKVYAASVFVMSLAMGAQALVCDKAYHFQSAYEVVLSGKTTATLTQASRKDLDKSFSGTTILHEDTQYEMYKDFDGAGSCSAWKPTSIDLAFRKKGDQAMGSLKEADDIVKLEAGNYPGAGPDTIKLDYWFGFADSLSNPVSIHSIIGKAPGQEKLHVWYGNATMKKDIIQANVGTVLRTLTFRYLELNNHVDSAALRKVLLDGWKNEADNDTQKVTINLQLIRVTFDSLPSPTSGARVAARKAAGFQAAQTGALVFIRPGEAAAGPAQPLSLFNMLGHKVAVLHPTGYLYQWNGRTSAGADAPTGVYFVQAGSRILGKFFYTR